MYRVINPQIFVVLSARDVMTYLLHSKFTGFQTSPFPRIADIGEIWRIPGVLRSAKALLLCLVLGPTVAACGVQVAPESVPPGNRGFAGVAISDEPRATLAARGVILAGGNAADAAAATALSLSVTLPSRAGLRGSGICTVHDPNSKKTEVLKFRAGLPRGVAALLARYGSRGWSNAVAPAEALARFGFPASKRLTADLAAHGGTLMNDQFALSAFMDRRRQLVATGTDIKLPALADTLQMLRTRGPDAVPSETPEWMAASEAEESGVVLAGTTLSDPQKTSMTAATSFIVADKAGMAVGCVLSMGTPFGTGETKDGYFAARPVGFATAPVVGFDVQHTHIVFIGAAYGPASDVMIRKAVEDWLVGDVAYDKVRADVQALAGDGSDGGMNAVMCRQGLALMGLACRTMTDLKGFGLGQTFGPDVSR
jgi:gamma-glutamyltranspeptidase/glutathione hydrolase